MQKDDLIFCITKEELQFEAMQKLGRVLNEKELFVAKNAFTNGLDLSVDIIYNTIFTEMI